MFNFHLSNRFKFTVTSHNHNAL